MLVCFFFKRTGEEFSSDHLADRESEKKRERRESKRERESGCAAASLNLNLNSLSYTDLIPIMGGKKEKFEVLHVLMT